MALPSNSAGRIVLAIVLSLTAHTAILFAPIGKLPQTEKSLPLLTAKLEPLPKVDTEPILEKITAHAPVKTPELKPKQTPVSTSAIQPVALPESNGKQSAENIEATRTEAPTMNPAQPSAMEMVKEHKPAHPLPKYAQLTFIAYKGTDFQIGEARHFLEIDAGKTYKLKVDMNTTGLASVFKTFELKQQSTGVMTALGLQPNEYIETKNTSKGKETFEAKFDREEKTLSFLNGARVPLPDHAQDIISFLYQLSQRPLDKGTIVMHISNGRKLERYELAVGKEEITKTHLGELRAVPLRKVHGQGEEGLDIWLGMEYRMLPVKIRQIDRDGQIAGEMLISEIRVSDE
jgi:hypothetical protein